jgi:hypothetical protein
LGKSQELYTYSNGGSDGSLIYYPISYIKPINNIITILTFINNLKLNKMKSLKNFNEVQEALVKIAQKGVVANNNGTAGMRVKCFLWNVEELQTKEYRDLTTIIMTKKFAGVDYSQEMKKRDELPPAEAMMVFRLLEPMNIKGTKTVYVDGKPISPEIIGCTEFRIPQNIVNYEALDYEETEDTEVNMSGQPAQVVILDLKKCIIDVVEGQRDFNNPNKWFREARAYVADIPFKTMQQVGRVLGKAKADKSKAMNYMSDDQLSTFNITL